MTYDPERHHRRSIRLRGYDYAQPGAYFVTICVQDRLCLFGDIVDGEMRSNAAGLTIDRWWHALPSKFPGIGLDVFVAMPNHFHGLIFLGADPATSDTGGLDTGRHTGLPLRDGARAHVGADQRVRPASQHDGAASQPVLGTVIQWFKTMTTNDYVAGVNHMDWPPFNRRLWQRNYHDRIVCNDTELDRIRLYIANNPANWLTDDENPERG